MASVTVTRNSQVTVPKEIREVVGIKEGTKINLVVNILSENKNKGKT
ncbi:MAG: AbrB/MazE/SpoVT family DNA-binding domain-containing protein [Crenarchaeota archaeon]|nr:AbrB/MazE/SpoVT family DNA-binding domain-containing protein [Thermoproteota archaeon]